MRGAGSFGFPPGFSTAAEISAAGPLGASTVQAALDQLRLRLGGSVEVVDSLADLDVHAPAIGGIRTISSVLLITDMIVLPVGERIAYGAESALIGVTSARCSITGDYAGPLFSGPVVMSQLAVSNTSVDPAASVFAITDLGGRTIRLEYCAIGAGARAGTISNTTGPVTLDRVFFNGCGGGFVLSAIVAVFEAVDCASNGLPAGSIVFDIGSSTNIIVAFNIESCSFLTSDASDRGIRISSSATLPGGPLPTAVVGANLIDCKITGPGQIYDTGAGTLSLDSPRLIVTGCPNLPPSKYLADTDFQDIVEPIVRTYVGPTPTPYIPVDHQNAGATSVLELLDVSARFTLVRNGAVASDWYLRYDGPTRQTVQVNWSVTIEAAGGGGAGQFIEFHAERDAGGIGVWTSIPGSHRQVEQRTVAGSQVCSAFAVMDPGDRFLLASRNLTGTGSTKILQFDLIVGRI